MHLKQFRNHPGRNASEAERQQYWVDRRENKKARLRQMMSGWDPVQKKLDEQFAADPDINKPHVLTKMALDVIRERCTRPSDFFKGFHLMSRLLGLDQTTQKLEHSIDPTALAEMKKYLIDHDVKGLEDVKKPSEVIIDVPAQAVDAPKT